MTFSDAINKIMPDVQSGSVKPFLIYRDGIGGWQCDYTRDKYGDTFGWVKEAKAQDPFFLELTGKELAGMSFPSVYDKVLSGRLIEEFHRNKESGMYSMASVESWFEGMEESEAYSFICFFDENAGSFSQAVMDYLASIERPFAAFCEMCPCNIAMNRNVGQTYNEDFTQKAIECVEEAVRGRLRERDGKAMASEHCIKDSRCADFTGKALIVKADALMPKYREPSSQIVLCTHGSGARLDAKGRSIFCKELASGKTVVYYRHEIEGIADTEKLPRWAKAKLAETEAKAHPQKTKAADKKPSLMSRLDAAKAEAAELGAQRGDAPRTAKRNEMEV